MLQLSNQPMAQRQHMSLTVADHVDECEDHHVTVLVHQNSVLHLHCACGAWPPEEGKLV